MIARWTLGLALCALASGAALAAPPARTLTAADLAPISLGPKDAEARDLMARQRWSEAAALVSGSKPEIRMARGWLWLEADEDAKAVDALQGLPEKLPLMADQIRVWQAEAHSGLGDPERALEAAQKVNPGGPFRWMARRFQAKALRELGRLQEAHQVYGSLIESGRHGDVAVGLLGQAKVFIDEEKPESALPLLKRLYAEKPTHWAARSGATLAEGVVSGRADLSHLWRGLTVDEQIGRAEALLKVHRNAEVIAALTPLTEEALTSAQGCTTRYTLGRALRKKRRYAEAHEQLTVAVERCAEAKDELLPWARYRLALLEERMAKEDEAGDRFKGLMEKHKDHRLGDDGGFYLVKHLLDDKKDPAAARKVVRRLVRELPEGDMVSEALFFTVVDAIERKEYDAALSLLALHEKLPPEPTHKHGVAGRAAYWQARLRHLKGQKKKAVAGYKAVIMAHPLSWYGALAYSRLRGFGKKTARRTLAEALAREPDAGGLPGSAQEGGDIAVPRGLDPEVAKRAVLLARLGLAELSWEALKGAGKSDEMKWFSASLLHGAGAWRISHNILRRTLRGWQRQPPSGALRRHWEMAYPKAYDGLVKGASEAAEIDPFFTWAIMREESGFNPAVQSFANAFGLMQLILPTAKAMAKKGEKPITRNALKIPDVNVRLGTRYLSHISDRVRDTLPLLPSGYNAGPGALRRWLKARGKLPLDLWVELIPFEETRWYTRSVVGSWVTYSYLYGPKGKDLIPVLSMKLPKYGKKKGKRG